MMSGAKAPISGFRNALTTRNLATGAMICVLALITISMRRFHQQSFGSSQNFSLFDVEVEFDTEVSADSLTAASDVELVVHLPTETVVGALPTDGVEVAVWVATHEVEPAIPSLSTVWENKGMCLVLRGVHARTCTGRLGKL